MPAAGYRKGISDAKAPLAVFARTRLPVSLHQQLVADAGQRRMTVSKLVRAIIEHHYRNRPLPRVKATGLAFAATRELNRIGVNLNQLAHLANATRVMPAPEIRQILARIETTIAKL